MKVLETPIISKTSGSGDSLSQTFYSNYVQEIDDTVTTPLYFNVPVYNLIGATENFYRQDTAGISANLNNIKSFQFIITANTNSLSGTTKMRHDIYRIDYNTYTAFTSSDISLTSTTTNLSAQSSGATSNSTVLTVLPNSSTAITQASLSIFNAITQPFYTFYEDVSGATFFIISAHTLTLPQKIKPTGGYTQDLCIDKGQYFIDSTFLFEQPVDQTLGDVQMFSGNQAIQLYNMPFSSTSFVQTSNKVNTITGGTFAGTQISGATFTYFVPPKKADIFVVNDMPAVEGTLNTFAPIFSFKNVEDGDYYKVQVSYNVNDTAFTGATTIFKFSSQPGNAEYVRAVAAALTPNAQFLYRIGNTKEIINLFSVKQNVTTWSESFSATTANDGNFKLSGFTYLNRVGVPISGASITITVLSTISSVDLGSDTITDSSITSEVTNPLGAGAGTSITILSDVNGFFDFGRISGGLYKITAQALDPNLPSQTLNMVISSDTSLSFIFSITWGSTTVDFTQPYTFL